MARLTPIPLPTCSYVSQDPQASCKRLVNCFAEQVDGSPYVPLSTKDSNLPPIVLRRLPGITKFTSGGSNSGIVRGLWEMAGVQYAVIANSLYSYTVSAGTITFSAALGTVAGSGFVRMCDNGACMTILLPGTSTAYTYSIGGGFQALTNTFFTSYGAIDCWFIDSYTVFLANNGTTFFNDDGRGVSGNNQITFTTQACFVREFGTDKFVGGTVDHREVLIFGTRTTEGYVNAGNAVASPFASAPDTYMQIGAHPAAAYSVVNQDQSVFWLASDCTIRRRDGQTPVRVSNSGIEQILAAANSAGQLIGCYGLAITMGGHPLYVLTIPAAGRTLVYDCLMQQWCEAQSNGIAYWRPLCTFTGLGYQLIGDSQGQGIGFSDVTAFEEYGTQTSVIFATQPVYAEHQRMSHRRLELVCTVGAVVSGSDPTVTLGVSNDGGNTFYQRPDVADLGASGATQTSAVWSNIGQSRSRVYQFTIVGNTPLFTVNINTEIDQGIH